MLGVEDRFQNVKAKLKCRMLMLKTKVTQVGDSFSLLRFLILLEVGFYISLQGDGSGMGFCFDSAALTANWGRYGFTRHHQTRYDIPPLLWTFDRLGTHENTVIGLQLNIGIQWHVQLLNSKQSERYDLKCKSSEYGEILEIHIGNVVKLEWTSTTFERQ